VNGTNLKMESIVDETFKPYTQKFEIRVFKGQLELLSNLN